MLNESMDRAKPFERGQEQAEAMLAMQKELLETCDQASRAWLDRVKSEVELWTELATKLSSTRSLPGRAWYLSAMCDAANANGRGRRTPHVG